jgi:hypothetical protein
LGEFVLHSRVKPEKIKKERLKDNSQSCAGLLEVKNPECVVLL